MSDHAKIARDLLKGSLSDAIADHPQAVEGMNAMVSRAHVEATLALVEQQRIANLIAVLDSAENAQIHGLHEEAVTNSWAEKLTPAIVEGLGLNEGENE